MDVAFLNPADDADPFFGLVVRAMASAARALGVRLEVLEGRRDRDRYQELALELAGRAHKPDYLLFVNDLETAPEILPQVTVAGIGMMMIFDGFSTADRLQHGEPGQRHPHWIAELLPDDRDAGRTLAEILVATAVERGLRADDGRVHLAALSGPFTHSSVLRLAGLRAALSGRDDVVLSEVAPAGWDRNRAFTITRALLDRHPELAVVWTANDAMGLGALDAAEASGRRPGEDLLLGGIDWAAEAVERLADGRYHVSLGGHFLDGAWALVLLRQHHDGSRITGRRARSRLVPMTAGSVDRYVPLVDGERLETIDFSSFPPLGPDVVLSAELAIEERPRAASSPRS